MPKCNKNWLYFDTLVQLVEKPVRDYFLLANLYTTVSIYTVYLLTVVKVTCFIYMCCCRIVKFANLRYIANLKSTRCRTRSVIIDL